MTIRYEDVLQARDRIKDHIYHTPLDKSIYLSNENSNVYLKLECQQKVKSFKIRGALSKMTSLSEDEKERGIMAVSSGNHGAAVSYASGLLGIKNTTVFVPNGTPESKIEKIKYFGANVRIVGKDYDEAHEIAMDYLEKERLTFIDPCSDIEVIAGQGTIALEILEQNPDIDTILVPVGGGGMITGISVAAKAIKSSIRVIGLQTEACPAMIQSMKDKKFYETYPIGPSICDALVGGVGEIPYDMSDGYIDHIIEVKEEMIAKAVPFLINKEKIVAEPSGAIGVAAILSDPLLIQGKNVAIVISGGNIDESLMRKLLIE